MADKTILTDVLNITSKRVISGKYIFLFLLFLDVTFFVGSYFISSYLRFRAVNFHSAMTSPF